MRNNTLNIGVVFIAANIILFGVFKTDTQYNGVFKNAKMYLISNEQIEYLMIKSFGLENAAIYSMSKYILDKNTLWKDMLDLRTSVESNKENDVYVESDFLVDNKKTIGVSAPNMWIEREIKMPEALPEFTELYYSDAVSGIKYQSQSSAVDLSNGVKLKYYIKGQAADRVLLQGDFQGVKISQNTPFSKLKLRFWVAKDGRVNQVMIEEGSAFPAADQSIVKAVKKWRFNPIYRKASGMAVTAGEESRTQGNYEWGILYVGIEP